MRNRFTKKWLASLQLTLDEMERTNPVVRAAAKKYDEVVRKILSRPNCPHCGRRHHNGKFINGVDVYRCLGCGESFHSKEIQ